MKHILPLLFTGFLLTTLHGQEFKPLRKVNSPYRETNLSITPNGKILFFMSHRGGQPWSVGGYSGFGLGDGGYDGDIWYSYNKNGVWQKPRIVDYPINTSKGEDEPSISMDGQTVYFQSWRNDWQATGGPYYQARLDGRQWKDIRGLGGEITRFFVLQQKLYDYTMIQQRTWTDILTGNTPPFGTDGMAVSPDGNIMIFSFTNYERKEHNMDLFISYKLSGGNWSYPQPLSVNTRADEISVFIAGDNKTLYFASDRAGGSGGFDIYKTTLSGNESCTGTKNLGAPYNTRRDDYSFIVNSIGDKGYLIRDGDIYEMTLTEQAKPAKTFVVNGIVKDNTGRPLQAKITVKSPAKNLTDINSNKSSGEFSFALPWPTGKVNTTATLPDGRRQSVEIPVTSRTPSPYSTEIIFPAPKPGPSKVSPPAKEEVVDKLEDKTLLPGQVITAEKILFEADTSKIQEGSMPGLEQIAHALIKRKDLTVEIGGHTNGTPPHEYCDRLSTARAKAVYEYLIAKGVDRQRLRYKGYGKRKPIASNQTATGRKRNQRVEFKILKVE